MGIYRMISLAIFAVPDPLVGTARVAEFLVGAVLGDPPMFEHHDLVHLIESV